MKDSSDIRLVFITAGSFDNARHIARILINEKLAACCNIINNIVSIYEWNEQLEESGEILIIIKTSAEKLDSLEQRALELHEYEIPEIISLKVGQISEKYYDWLINTMNIANDFCI